MTGRTKEVICTECGHEQTVDVDRIEWSNCWGCDGCGKLHHP